MSQNGYGFIEFWVWKSEIIS